MQKKTLQLDDLDKKIIKSLIMNSRKSSRQLSKEVKVSHQTILSRLKGLEDSRIIQSYTTAVDWEKLGYPLKTMFLIECGKLDQKSFDSIEKYLNGEDSFVQFGALHGEYDYFILGQFRNEREVSEKATALRTFLSKQVDLKKFGHHTVWKHNQKQNQDL